MKTLIFSMISLMALSIQAGATAKAPIQWTCFRWAEQPAVYQCSNGMFYAHGNSWCRVTPGSSRFDHEMYPRPVTHNIFCGVSRKDDPEYCEKDNRPDVVSCYYEMENRRGSQRIYPQQFPRPPVAPRWPSTPPYFPGQNPGYGPGTPAR